MGWETGISLGASAVQGLGTLNNAEATTKAMAQSADNTVANMANKTARTEGTLETSFLKGGIALGGAGGTSAVFQQAGQQGQTDIQRTIDNANANINNTMNTARGAVLDGLGKSFSKLGPGTLSAGIASLYQGSDLQSAWNSVGQDVGGMLDPSPTGPYQAFGV